MRRQNRLYVECGLSTPNTRILSLTDYTPSELNYVSSGCKKLLYRMPQKSQYRSIKNRSQPLRNFFAKLKCQSRTIVLSLDIEYSTVT